MHLLNVMNIAGQKLCKQIIWAKKGCGFFNFIKPGKDSRHKLRGYGAGLEVLDPDLVPESFAPENRKDV